MGKRISTTTKDRAITSDLYRRLWRARRFIDRSYHLPIDLGAISGEACISPYHFLRLFRMAFNRTPHQYLTERRIEKAKELLSSSELSVTDVCLEVGFESLGSFSSLFHKHVGYPPIAYRTLIYERQQTPQQQIPACFLIMHRMVDCVPAKD